jgi:helix-turn-helix protein
LMYSDDVDVDFVKTTMNISENELNSFVSELVQNGFLEFVSEDEIKLTKSGLSYVKNQETSFL